MPFHRQVYILPVQYLLMKANSEIYCCSYKSTNIPPCNRGYRFHFPHPPSNETIISEQSDDTSDCIQVLTKVCKVLTDNPNDLTMNELLAKADVTLDQYVSALQVSTKGSVVILKRKPSECNINNHNASVMLAWQANMDIQYVLNAYACVMYVASYIMKTEKFMGELLKHVQPKPEQKN